METQQDWARRMTEDDPHHLQVYVDACENFKDLFNGYYDDLIKQINQTEGKLSCLDVF